MLAHPECDADVLTASDFVGSSESILVEAKRIASEEEAAVMMITECGTAERAIAESEKPIQLMEVRALCARHRKEPILKTFFKRLNLLGEIKSWR